MPYGIGGGGQLGIGFEQLTAPVAVSATPTAGGALTAGTYKYYITAINANGETTVSNELTGTTAAGNLTLALVWNAVTGATGYKVYRTAAAGATGSELLLTTLGLVTTYNDTAVGAPAGAFPTINTASSAGTYAAPTLYIPFNSESLSHKEETMFRRPIRKSVDVVDAVPGNEHDEGDIEIDAREDCVAALLMAARTTVAITGTSPNFIYTHTPNPNAIPNKTISLTIERVTGVVFGYTGVTISSFKFSIADGVLLFTVSVIGRQEASQSVPVPTWPTTSPYGAGMYSMEIPTATPVTDTDSFEFSIEDNAEAQFRMKNTGRGADFVKFGERNTTLTIARDFLTRTDYDNFKAIVAQTITMTASKGANNSISMLIPNTFKNTYETNLSGQGDLVRAQITYTGVLDPSTSRAYQIVIKSQVVLS